MIYLNISVILDIIRCEVTCMFYVSRLYKMYFPLLYLYRPTFRDTSTRSMVLRTANTLNIRCSTKENISNNKTNSYSSL